MAASLNRAAFYKAVRSSLFGGKLTAAQVAGMDAILDAAPALLGTTSLGYGFATAFHEVGATMQPIEEWGRGKGKTYGSTGFWGRGLVQLTWEENYRKATKRLRELGILKPSEDLVKTPALAMRPDVACAILWVGMVEGWFTGKKLADYFGGGRYDPVGARRIINGTDRAALIAGQCGKFVEALRAAGHSVVPGAAPPLRSPGETQAGLPLTKPDLLNTKPAPTGGLSSAPSPAPVGFWAGLLSTVKTNMQKGH